MATSYEQTTTSSATVRPLYKVSLDKSYITSLPGILKIAEFVLCIALLICLAASKYTFTGHGWANFVAWSAMFTTAILFILHLLSITANLSNPWSLIEFIYHVFYVVCFLIAAIMITVVAYATFALAAACVAPFTVVVVVVVSTLSSAWARTRSQTPARGPPSFSPHTSSSAATPTGSVHKSQTFFSFLALAVFSMDCFLMYRGYSNSRNLARSGGGGNVTTTTTTFETHTVY